MHSFLSANDINSAKARHRTIKANSCYFDFFTKVLGAIVWNLCQLTFKKCQQMVLPASMQLTIPK